MLAHVLCLFVLFAGSLAKREDVIIDGAFNYPFVVDEDIKQSSDASTLIVSFAHRCVRSFYLLVEVDDDSLVTVERISGVLATGGHSWSRHGESLVSSGVELSIPATGKACASTWRFLVYNKKVSWKALAVDGIEAVNTTRKRQATTCDYDMNALYPPECSSASDGALCVTAGTCGCKVDEDCFGNTDFPYCSIAAGAAEGQCDRCTIIATATAPNADHYFCRTRYPGYATQPTDGSNLPNERAAPLNYFREYCVRTPPTSSGACQRCNQAPLITTLPAAWSLASRQGASGTIHCNSIRPTTAPICMDQTYMTDTSGTYDVNLRGSCVPCAVNAQCARALPATPICDVTTGTCKKCATNADCGSLTGFNTPNCQADGSCALCTSNANCGSLDGGEKAAQSQCSTATGICVDPFVCTDNPSCVGQSGANCQADKTCLTCTSNSNCGTLDGGETPGQQVCATATGICGSCGDNKDCTGTSGANCQADGSCKTCLSDTDCGSLDGGSQPGQTKCDTTLGLCTTPFMCTDNASCQPSATTGGNNCQAATTCVSCTGTATCGALDGGETPGQPNCNVVTRICVNACAANADCASTQGNNCMADGICKTCTINADCNNDGGEKPGQTICDVPSGICTSPCAMNSDCPAGANCQADGTCLPCAGSNANCGALDGGETPGQPICAPTGICGPCTSNNDCKGNGKLSNCGVSGSCYDCSAPGMACGSMDGPAGGPLDNQPHCDSDIGTCVDYCTLDAHCLDSCVPHCNVQKGCCVECLTDDDCPHDNWRDAESLLTSCSVTYGQCVPGCLVDGDCTGDTPACDASTRTCVGCADDSHCADNQSGTFCTADHTCGDSPYGGSSSGVSIAALVIAIIALVLVCLLIIYVATIGGGHERV